MTVWRAPATALAPAPVLFLDRDGVVIEDRHYLADPEGVVLVAGAADAMRTAHAAGFRVVGVSNQSGLGRGRFGPGEFAAVMERLEQLLASEGAAFDAFHYCPHGPDDGCRCRKPAPGLLEEAALRVPFDPARSWVIGDKASDVALALGAGLGAVLVHTGYGAGASAGVQARWGGEPRVLQAPDLPAAIAAILARGTSGQP